MSKQSAVADTRIRPLAAGDLETVIEIDGRHAGRPRRRFFQKRFDAAGSHPDGFIHLGIEAHDELVGFALLRVLRGEFGGDEPVAALDVIGVDPTQAGRGYGRSLLQGIASTLSEARIHSLRSQAEWKNSELLRFFEGAGFELAPRLILERSTSMPFFDSIDD
ncbi:MAG: GNAT family N-acetyltransferase [Gammaproteobacteria bacterium]|nr:GNAT family N-acetyltransferase [Gammaproteobacteria bacterium]MDH4254252.1 GNAT family N-acetyltransferase [Gammaproteobacteria bacterium]MDH5311024.1 GNAT family N-acetyltransferase [Gammaproteobacteria bacterium]